MMIKLLGFHPNTLYEVAEKALETCSYRLRAECVDIVRKLKDGTPCSMMIPDDSRFTTGDWDEFCKTFMFNTIIPMKEPVEPLKLFRGSVPPKKNTGKKGKVNGRQEIKIMVLAHDEDEAFGYMVDYVESLGDLYSHVKPDHIFCAEIIGPFESGYIISASPNAN